MPGSCHQLTVAQRSRKPWPYLRPVIPVIPPAVEWMLGSQGVQGYSVGSVPRTRAVPTREAIEGRSRAPPTLSFVVTQSSGLAPKVDSGAARVGDRRLTKHVRRTWAYSSTSARPGPTAFENPPPLPTSHHHAPLLGPPRYRSEAGLNCLPTCESCESCQSCESAL